MNNIEERIENLKANIALSELIGPDELTVTVSDLSALIAQLEAAQRDRNMHYQVSEKFRIELIATEAELSAANEKLRGEQVPVAVAVAVAVAANNGVTAENLRVIKMLLDVCGTAFELADDSCQQDVDGELCHVVPDSAFSHLSDALGEIENTLPDEYEDLPNIAAIPRHALQELFTAAPQPAGSTVEGNADAE